MRPVCVTCKRVMRPSKTGATVEFLDGNGDSYQIFMGDAFKCDGCLAEIIAQWGQRPVSEHFQPGHKAEVEHAYVRGVR